MICYVFAMGKQNLGPHVVVGYGIKIFVPRPLHYVTSSPGKQTWIFRSMVSQKKRICGNAGCTKYRGKISPRAMDSGYVACISKEAKNPTCTMFLLIFLWQNPIQDRHPNHGERSFYTGLQHLVKRHRLSSAASNTTEKNCKTSCA